MKKLILIGTLILLFNEARSYTMQTFCMLSFDKLNENGSFDALFKSIPIRDADKVIDYQSVDSLIDQQSDSSNLTKEIVMMAELKNDAEAIEKYEYFHSAEGVWPEVIHAARVSGFEKIKIYRFSNKLVMILTLPKNLDIDEVNRKYAASGNRIKEWGELMDSFMQTPGGAEEGSIWVPMKIIHDYENGVVK